jgi:predicted DNA-binding transcriptional regulator YafY
MLRKAYLKTKLLLLLDILREETDEEHALTTAELIAYLEENEIHCDRKTLYSDIQALRDYGFDIEQESTRVGGGYRLISRDFEMAELKLLVDAVQSSKFITVGKSKQLIEKLSKLTSRHKAKELSRQVYVTSRGKSVNESILYSVDAIHRAMQENCRITFSYLEWNLEKKLQIRGKKTRIVSPWALIYDDKNYYLVAYDGEDQKLKHFRVDKMDKVNITDSAREGGDSYSALDLGQYAGESFGMFSGEKKVVSLDCENKLIGVMIDRFGQDVSIRKLDEDHFRLRQEVVVSGQFFGWLSGIGSGAVISAPADVREKYLDHLGEIIANHKEGDRK